MTAAATARHLGADQVRQLAAALEELHTDRAAVLAEREAAAGDASDDDRKVEQALAVRAREALDDVEHALARIADGTYGTCEACGVAIPFERLEAVPDTRRCIACLGRSAGVAGRLASVRAR